MSVTRITDDEMRIMTDNDNCEFDPEKGTAVYYGVQLRRAYHEGMWYYNDTPEKERLIWHASCAAKNELRSRKLKKQERTPTLGQRLYCKIGMTIIDLFNLDKEQNK